jgi:hypothetical protein
MTKSLFVIACILLAPKSAMDKQKALVIFMVIVFFLLISIDYESVAEKKC